MRTSSDGARACAEGAARPSVRTDRRRRPRSKGRCRPWRIIAEVLRYVELAVGPMDSSHTEPYGILPGEAADAARTAGADPKPSEFAGRGVLRVARPVRA